MSEMVNDRGFLEDDFQQNLDTLKLHRKAEYLVEELDSLSTRTPRNLSPASFLCPQTPSSP